MTLKTNGSIKVMANELVGWPKEEEEQDGRCPSDIQQQLDRSMLYMYMYSYRIEVVYFTAEKL
jgi:hypothetical protein